MGKKLARGVCGLGFVAALGWTTLLRAEAIPMVLPPLPCPVPLGPERKEPPNGQMLVIGGSTFILAYGAAAVAGLGSDDPRDLFIPIAGPWLYLGHRDGIETAALIVDGLLQGVGALTITSSFFVSSKGPRPVFEGPIRMPAFAIVPTAFGGRGLGAMARGRF